MPIQAPHSRPAGGPRLGRRSLLALAALAPLAARAQEWPERPLRLIIPFQAGSTPDVTGRALAEHLRSALGQPCVIENRTGASGTIGYAAVAQATDNHTLGICTNGMATASVLFPQLPFNPLADLRYLSLLTRAPQVLVVRPGLPVRSLDDLVAEARRRPGQLTFGSVGVGSASQLAMEEVREKHGVDLVHAPYAGLPQAKLDLLAGRIDVMFGSAPSVLEEVRAGTLHALALAAGQRDPQLPQVPTMAEAGMPGAESYAWNTLFAPRSLPEAHAARLAEAARAAMAQPRTIAAMRAAGFEVVASSPADCEATMRAEIARWGSLVRRRGIEING